jgi:acetylornithine deacetylase/succinyl-diaminopimelate desuccinylase-like protein
MGSSSAATTLHHVTPSPTPRRPVNLRLRSMMAGEAAAASAEVEVALQAPLDSPTYGRMRAAVEEFAPEAHVVPFSMAGGTDAKQFSRLGITGYGFAPLKLPEGFDYQALFHGVDERVPVEALHFGVHVLDRFLRTA